MGEEKGRERMRGEEEDGKKGEELLSCPGFVQVEREI